MLPTQPFDILLAHDRWATRQILLACEALTDEQFHQAFEIGPGSLFATATHLLGAVRGWTDQLLEAKEPRGRLEKDGVRRSPAELLALQAIVADEFEAIARAQPLDGTITAIRGGQAYTFSRGAVITHVMTHGTHHRAQCLNMLRRLGVTKLPLSSVLEWIRSDGK